METAHNTQRVANMSNNKIARGNIVFCEHQNKTKSLFQSKEEADAQARQENLKRPADKQLVPYYCKSCGGWHLGINKRNLSYGVGGYAAHKAAQRVEAIQWRGYHKEAATGTGHGYAAEDANAQADRLRGRRVEQVGKDNMPDGPDKIVNGKPVQVKYCYSAEKTISTSFDKNTGEYRYPGQQLEVPKDQYEEAVKLMEQKICEGKVPGVTDPVRAKDIVKKGSVTYHELVQITKPMTKESLWFDVKNQAGASATVGGIAAGATFISAKMHGASTKEALKASGKQGVSAATKTMVTGVGTQQFLRTSAGKVASKAIEKGVERSLAKVATTELGKKVVERTAVGLGGQAAVRSASTTLARTASSNVVTATAAFVVCAIPDTVKLCTGKISGKEFGERTACNGAGVVGGTGGAWAGAAIGSCFCPGIGTAIGGFIGGIVGGMGASTCVGKLFRRN